MRSTGPIMALSKARIYLMCGDHETALALLEHSVQTPAGITMSELRVDPIWDALRQEPRFQKLTAEPTTTTTRHPERSEAESTDTEASRR